MKLARRLDIIWRNKKRFHPRSNVSAGRAAELQVASLLEERLRNSAYQYFPGVRVPSKKRRHEIDFVITTPEEIWVVELKNWSGFVNVDGSRVIQHRSHGRGVVDHGNLLGGLRRKERALKSYLRRSIGSSASVPNTWIVLVFCNNNIAFAEELFEVDDMDIVRLPEFLSALPAPPAQHGSFWGGLTRLFGKASNDDDPARLPTAKDSIVAANKELARLGTWDLLALHGGRIISGDIVDISKPVLDDRDRFQRLRIDAPRSIFNLFRSELHLHVTATDRGGTKHRYELDFDQKVRFHAAGQPKPTTFSLRDVVAISFGYT